MANDMEKRQKYMVKTSFMQKVGDFNTKERPKYIQCSPSVQKEISGNPDSTKFFAYRYGQNSPQVTAVDNTYKMLKEIKANIPNVFIEIGASARKQ